MEAQANATSANSCPPPQDYGRHVHDFQHNHDDSDNNASSSSAANLATAPAQQTMIDDDSDGEDVATQSDASMDDDDGSVAMEGSDSDSFIDDSNVTDADRYAAALVTAGLVFGHHPGNNAAGHRGHREC